MKRKSEEDQTGDFKKAKTENVQSRDMEKKEVQYNITYHDVLGGSPEYFQQRNELVFHASSIASAFHLGRSFGKRQPYSLENWYSCIVLERGQIRETEKTELIQKNMDFGIQHEKHAASQMSLFLNDPRFSMEEVGFYRLEALEKSQDPSIKSLSMSISPDRLIRYRGERFKTVIVYEAKCPPCQILYKEPFPQYLIQVQSQIHAFDKGDEYCTLGILHCWTLKQSRLWIVQRDDELWCHILLRLSQIYEDKKRGEQVPSQLLVEEYKLVIKKMYNTVLKCITIDHASSSSNLMDEILFFLT